MPKEKAKNQLTPADKNRLRLEVKRANQRLAELEKKNLINASNAYGFVYTKKRSGKATYLRMKDGDKPRFRTDIASMNQRQIEALEKNVQKFLGSKTSTPTGIATAFDVKSYETFKDRHVKDGSELSLDDYSLLFKTELFTKLKGIFGSSDQAIEAYQKMKEGNIKNPVAYANRYMLGLSPDEADAILDRRLIRQERVARRNTFQQAEPLDTGNVFVTESMFTGANPFT